MKKIFWALIVLAIFIVVFSVQNASAVKFTFLAWSGEISLAVLLIVTFIAGVLVGALYSVLNRIKEKDANLVDEPKEEVTINE